MLRNLFNNNTSCRLPAEWEAQWGVQLTWPHEGTDWAPYLTEIEQTFVQLAEVITQEECLIVVAQDTTRPQKLLSHLRKDRIFWVECPTNDTWARDHGPIILCGPIPIAYDYRFNGWGKKFPSDKDNRITKAIVEQLKLSMMRVGKNYFVLEGGSIESDGRGTILTTSRCLLEPHRNPQLLKKEIEDQLLNDLYAERVLWLQHGMLVGDDTDGHIDTLARFAPNDTILYVACDDASDVHYDELKAMENELRAFQTTQGTPYLLRPLPLPDPVFYDGERLPATYANFLVINNVVICPTYGQPDKDREALRIIGEAFPGRRLVPIDATVIVRQHGSIHCLTMQYPADTAPFI